MLNPQYPIYKVNFFSVIPLDPTAIAVKKQTEVAPGNQTNQNAGHSKMKMHLQKANNGALGPTIAVRHRKA